MSTSRTREKADGELFKSTGIDDNATSTAVTIDANENVGVGTASPSARFEVEDNGSATGNVIMKVTQDDQSSHYGMSVGNDSYSTVDSDGFVVYQMNNGHTYLYNGGVDEGPNIGMPVAGGITFGTDTAAANTLDDYEEGTWSPHITTTGTDFTTAGRASDGWYTKVGNMVTLWFAPSITTPSNGTGQIRITGLPFTARSSGLGTIPSSNIRWGRVDLTGVDGTYMAAIANTTNMVFLYSVSGSNPAAVQAADMNGNTTPFLAGVITYQV